MNNLSTGTSRYLPTRIRLLITAGLLLLTACSSGAGGGGGITGTGVTSTANGTVTGFGSVVVNGIHYTAKAGAIVQIDGLAGATEADLQPGMNVLVRGSINSGTNTGSYTSIEYRSDLKGPVQSVDTAAFSIVVLGQSVRIDTATILEGIDDLATLPIGTPVEVSGTRSSSGVFRASRLYRPALPDNQIRIKGRVTGTSGAGFTIGSQAISVTPQTVFNSPLTAADISSTDPRFLEITGTLNGAVVIATRIEQLNPAAELNGVRLDLRGTLVDITAGILLINSPNGPVSVNGSGAAVIIGSLAAAQPGMAVHAAGTINNGILIADSLEIERENNVRIEGNLTGIDQAGQRLTLNGITAEVTAQTIFRDNSPAKVRDLDTARLALSDHLQIGGYLETGAVPTRVILTRVERLAPSATSFIQGQVTQTVPNLTILGLPIAVTGTTSFLSLSVDVGSLSAFTALLTVNSSVVKAKGSFSSGPPIAFIATELELQP